MIKIIVPGGLNTDVIASKVSKLAASGEVVGEELKIGPGGKSRNIAQMIAALTGKDTVAMLGKTTKDPFGLWKVPYDALVTAGVNVEHVEVSEFTGIFPGVALISVDKQGNNQIYVLPGINNTFSSVDIDVAVNLFEQAGKNSGTLALSLEMPLPTALHAIDVANQHELRVVLDPGGMEAGVDYSALLQKKIFLLKPNEHETEMLSGVKVVDLDSAKHAAEILMRSGPQNVLITAGVHGAYLVTKNSSTHIPIPNITTNSNEKDATGCGDQTMATICALLSEGKDIIEAAKIGILSGTLQFHKAGITPVTQEELAAHL